jgi:hypothetical protein
MNSMRGMVTAVAMATLLATAAPGTPDQAEAGTPAPLPVQIPIRDIGAPPTPNAPPAPFVPRSAPKKHRRSKPARKRPTSNSPAQAPSPARASTGPKLEQRYEAPTESIYPLEPEPAKGPSSAPTAGKQPAPVAFPPEPAPAAAPAPAKP